MCNRHHTTRKAVIQHLANSGCDGSAICYCHARVTKDTATTHMSQCRFFGPIGCTICQDRLFKSLESANNHAWSAHGGGRFTEKIQPTVDFKMKAQVGTRFAHMQIEQLKERARNNTQKRMILKELVKESNFAAFNSKFLQLVHHFSNKTVPLFTKTQGAMREVMINTASDTITVRLNLLDKDVQQLWSRLAPLAVCKAQVWGIDINVHHDFADTGLSAITAQIAQVLEHLNVATPIVKQITSLTCKMVAIVRSKFDIGVIAALVIDTLVTSGIDMSLARSAWEVIKEHCRPVHRLFRGESFAQTSGTDPIASLATIVAILGGTILMKKIPRDSEISECVNGVTKLGGLVRGASFAWQGLEKLITFVLRKLFEWQTGLPAEVQTLEVFMSGVTQWFQEVQDLISLHTADDIMRSSELCSWIETLYRQGAQFSVMAAESKAPRELLQPFHMHWNVLQSLYNKATASGAFRAGPRVEPLVIYIYGGSGVGKSGLMYPLATDILKIDGIPADQQGRPDVTREIYMRNVEQEYWDGYTNQRAVIYDDFAQIVDSAGHPNPEFMELIRTGNLAPYPLHMAALEDKNKTYFTSRIVICTSNTDVGMIRPESISCKEAVRRRFDVCVEISNKAEYTTERDGKRYLDTRKVERITGAKHSLDVYNIWPVDPITGYHMTRQPIGYDDFARMCMDKYEARFTQSAHMFKFLREYAAAPSLRAQVLTEAEELRWITKLDCEARLCTLADMQEMAWHQIMNFQSILPELTHVLNDDAEFALKEFFARDMTGWTDERTSYEWTSMLQGVEVMWTPDASARLREMIKRDTCLFYSLGDVVTGLTDKAVVCSKVLLNRLRTSVLSFKERVLTFIQKVKDTLAAHPYITIGCAIVPLILFGMSSYFRSDKTVAVGPPLDHHHQGLARGVKTIHRHICLWCNDVYTHAHIIKKALESIQYPQVCGKCSRAGITCVFSMRDGETGFKLNNGHKIKFVPFALLHVELTGSGDALTKRKEQVRVELTGSGDALTKKKEQCRVEVEDCEDDDYTILDVEREAWAQLQTDPNALQVSKKVINNMYTIELKINDEWQAKMKMCFLIGRTALTAGHLIPYLEKATEVRIWNQTNTQGHVVPVNSLRWIKLEGSDGESKDQVLIEFPRSIHDHQDLTGSIASSTEMTQFKTCHGVLITPFDKTVLLRFGSIRAVDQEKSYYDDGLGTYHKYSIRKHYEYTGLETKDGDCGAMLMGVSSGLARKILGIHVAGAIGYGMSSPLNIQDIRSGLEKISRAAQISLDLTPVLQSVGTKEDVELPEGDFSPVGKALFQVASPSKTALRPSVIHGFITEPTTMPSALRPVKVDGKRVDPMSLGLKKAGKIPPFLDEQKLAVSVNDVERIINSNIDPDHKRVLSDMEAVTGVEGDPFLAPINRKSSPGFPLVREKKGAPGKMRWLGSDEYKLDAEIQQAMHSIEQNARENKRTATIWTDTLKDERRPLEKVKIGKTRVFSAGPMNYTLVFRKYFLGFAAHCAKNRIDNEISIGTNVYSSDWNRTATKLCSKGDKVIAGDFSNFDGTLVLQILADVVEIINKFYDDGEENAQIRCVLWKEIVNSVHLRGDNVYLWTHSQPSGCPITAILNSIYNSISMRYVWMLVMPKEYQTMKLFNKHVAMVSYGDDNCVNIHDDVIALFNQLTIAAGYLEMGMIYTDEAKTGVMIPYRTLSDIAYLKRTFTWSEAEHQYLAPLSLDVVLEMVNWIRGDFDTEERTIENMETSAFELSLHGKTTFEHWIEKYRNAAQAFERRPLFLTYEEYRDVEAQKYGRLIACNN